METFFTLSVFILSCIAGSYLGFGAFAFVFILGVLVQQTQLKA